MTEDQIALATQALARAVETAGGQTALARAVDTRQQNISLWLRNGLKAEFVLAVEKVTGVSRHDLRPDLYPREDKESTEGAAA